MVQLKVKILAVSGIDPGTTKSNIPRMLQPATQHVYLSFNI